MSGRRREPSKRWRCVGQDRKPGCRSPIAHIYTCKRNVLPDLFYSQFFALDPNFREEIRDILKELHRDTGVTVLMVTHDFAEARYLAQHISVINNGCIEQTGTVDAIFLKPATPFTAHFVGMHTL